MAFKDEIANDIDNVFLNLNDFTETHLVEGNEILCVLDNDSLKARQGSAEIGIDESTLLLFANIEDLPKKQKGGLLNIDHKEYIIDDWKVNFGMAEIVLHRNVTTY
jgi:hypothetical protein